MSYTHMCARTHSFQCVCVPCTKHILGITCVFPCMACLRWSCSDVGREPSGPAARDSAGLLVSPPPPGVLQRPTTWHASRGSPPSDCALLLPSSYSLYASHQHGFQEEATRQILGCIVLTRYNNRTYRVDDIVWDKNPQSTFVDSSGQPVRFLDYYK